jgi:predicted O-methyltransferase YrrM
MTEQEAIEELTPALDLERLNSKGPISFQLDLYRLIREHKPKVVVETGTRHGVATALIMEALRMNGGGGGTGGDTGGSLFSCDPIYPSQQMAEKAIKKAIGYEIDSECWSFDGTTSEVMLAALSAALEPSVDLFVHDSDHREKCMRMELEWAWEHTRPGGIIVCDDWKQPKHTAFLDFALNHGLRAHPLGRTAVWVRVAPA